MIDTHCHFDIDDLGNVDVILHKCKESGVDKIIVSGYDVESCKIVLELVNKYNMVYGTVGFLPSEVDNVTDSDLKYLENIITNNKIIGIGEIGLDYHYVKDNKEKQRILFEKQLLLAKKYNLPVVIHSRDSIDDTYNILKNYNIKRGTMHCYSGSLEYAYKFIDLGLFLSIGGVSTFKNAKEIKRVIENIDINHFLFETDSPYLTPEPYRGEKNYPYFIPLIANKVSEIKNIDIEVVKNHVLNNTLSLFDI